MLLAGAAEFLLECLGECLLLFLLRFVLLGDRLVVISNLLVRGHLFGGILPQVLAFPLRFRKLNPFASLARIAEDEIFELAGRRAFGGRFVGRIVFRAAELDAYR